jgi:hypothetical protein
MKKLIFTLMILGMGISLASAQETRFGFTAGGTLGQIRTNTENGKHISDCLVGFSAGVVADFPLSKSFSFQPSLQFLQKGGSESAGDGSDHIRLNYLDMPLNFIYRAPGTGGHFIAGIGPDLSLGLSGTETLKYNGISMSDKINFGSGDNNLKTLEFCGNVLVGYEWKGGFFLQANFNMGFNSLFNDSANPNSTEYWKNNYYGLRLGYFFGGK